MMCIKLFDFELNLKSVLKNFTNDFEFGISFEHLIINLMNNTNYNFIKMF